MDLWTISYLLLWAVVLIEGIVIVILVREFGSVFLNSRGGIERDGLAIGSSAPDFEATDLVGAPVKLTDFAGRWLVLFFASPGCGECYSMLGMLGEIQQSLAAEANIIYMYRGLHDDMEGIPELSAAPVRVVAAGRTGVAELYRARVSPYVQVMDAEGRVRAKGLVNSRGRLEHLLLEAGLRHPSLRAHEVAPSPSEV